VRVVTSNSVPHQINAIDIGKALAALTATCEARPEAGFVGHWREAVDYHVPLDAAVFNGIEADLRAFPGLIAAA
jgi:hypothetical protein